MGHHYQARVDHRTVMKSGCPFCAGKKVLRGFNDLESKYPQIAKEWDFSKNSIAPSDVIWGSNKSFWWICPRGHHYRARVAHRTKVNSGCPYCSNRRLLEGFNDFATLHPVLAREWDFERNPIRPSQITQSDTRMVWWICDHGHHFQATVKQRVRNNKKCPYCLH